MVRSGWSARADDEGGPSGVFIEKGMQGFQQKWEVLLVRFPAADGDNLILFGDGGVELKNISLNGVRNTVNLFWVGPQAGGEGFPKCGGLRSFYQQGWKHFQSAGQPSLDPGGSEYGGEGVEN